MRIRVYIDTNIFIYAIFHDPKFGSVCSTILRDMSSGLFDAYGSILVAIELLGSISKIEPAVASKATNLYFQLPHKILSVNPKILRMASYIADIVNLRYDSIHLAIMIESSINKIITNDKDDWYKAKTSFKKIKEKLQKEGFEIKIDEIDVITTEEYRSFKKNIAK
ncbi:MAG: type II toxin-antitoxin system VapC family toxin [Candidatus Njordarchaeota archaeon]